MLSSRPRRLDQGFTLPELLTVIAVITALLLMAIPVYISTVANAARRSCYQNQNSIQRAVEFFLASDPAYKRPDLEGILDVDHPLVANGAIKSVPRCPSGEPPADLERPTIAEGAYSLNANANVVGCTLGELGPHGSVIK